jgi:hypothetical protein
MIERKFGISLNPIYGVKSDEKLREFADNILAKKPKYFLSLDKKDVTKIKNNVITVIKIETIIVSKYNMKTIQFTLNKGMANEAVVKQKITDQVSVFYNSLKDLKKDIDNIHNYFHSLKVNYEKLFEKADFNYKQVSDAVLFLVEKNPEVFI